MEVLGILFSIPAALVASSLYCLFLAKVVSGRKHIIRWLRALSYVVLSLFAIEVLLPCILGAVQSRALLGPAFYIAHILFFFLGVPALANLLVLRSDGGLTAKWYVATLLCTALAFFLVLLQYGVSEALFGIDGEGGPYSQLIDDDLSRCFQSSIPKSSLVTFSSSPAYSSHSPGSLSAFSALKLSQTSPPT
jgi:hypothetical protein